MLQYTGLPLGAPGAPLELTFTMGNTDTIGKRLLVLVHNSSSDDSTACSFWLDPTRWMTSSGASRRSGAGIEGSPRATP